MIRRLFRWRKVSEARPSPWLDCDERECPAQHLVSREAGSVPNELVHGESLVGRGHRCSAARVDDYEGVSWLGRLDWPEWPVQEQSFENREEDLSVASCVESLWSRRCLRGRRGAQSLPAEADIAGRAGLQDWCSLRKDDCVRDAVMAKLGLQVTCLGSVSPMSKSYPGQKAIFSAYRGLNLYRSSGDTTMTAAAAAQRSLTSRNDLRDENDTGTKPGAGDHGHSYYQDGKYRESNEGVKDEQNEKKVLHQKMHEPHLTDAGCKSYETFLTKTPVVVSMCSNCSHLEGLLEEHEANAKKEGTLNESGDDGGALSGLANTSGSLDASTLSGDIKLDHIEDIGSRLHSTPTRSNGGCGVEEDRRLQLGLGDFDHLGGTVTCSRARGDTQLHVKVTCSGDCDQDSGGSSRLPATSSPIPTEADTGGACLGSLVEGSAIENEVTVLDEELLCSAEFAEAKTSADESFSSDMTVRRVSYGDYGDDAESEFASQQGSESAGEFIDAGFDTDYSEGAAVETDFFTHVDLHSNFREKRAARACGQQCPEWLDIDSVWGATTRRVLRRVGGASSSQWRGVRVNLDVVRSFSHLRAAGSMPVQITTSKRRLTYPSGPPELSTANRCESRVVYSLSTSFASDNCGVSEDASIEDVCSQIFSSYNESFTHFEEVQSFPALPRSNAAEMLTCPELRPLRLGGNAGDVFQSVLRRDQNKRLKRSTVPAAAASDTKATISKTSDKWCHMSSPSSVSMPDLKHSQNGTWPSDVQEQSGAAATSDANLSSEHEKKPLEELRVQVPTASFSTSTPEKMSCLNDVVDAFIDTCDPRVRTWPLMGSPTTVLLLMLGYMTSSIWWAPWFMRSREPLRVRRLVRAYNVAMVIWNAYFVVDMTRLWLCQGPNHSRGGLPLLSLAWWYLVMKLAEVFDTATFVVTKSFNHVTALHVFHHVSVIGVMWISVQTGVVGQNVFCMIVNALVNTLTYTYYFLATLGPEARKWLWWKRYLTKVQMAQLASFAVFGAVPLFVDCGFPRWMALLMTGMPLVLLIMFCGFYRRTYTAKGSIG
ncbi:hypothetical protein HPB50_003442 [Hyalomma asiaticum]|uniref:Uncharacterized protein n=1 Tax=Hyalomma asiaticum TaxID=266040 RepID=A0ACB7SMG7_HYAAI|nr:hypothetical protein HPB50_003442 [Hyalomma asiaticum]